jgi:hypothetical protein
MAGTKKTAMIRKGYIIIVCMGVLLSLSCRKKLSPEEYLKYADQEEHLNRAEYEGEFIIAARYRSAEALALREMTVSGSAKDKEAWFKEECKKYRNASYFDFLIRLKDGRNLLASHAASQEDYAYLVGELNYNMSKYLYLLGDEQDTIRMVGYNFLNSYGMSPDVRLQVAFPREALENKYKILVLVYEDKLFGINRKIRLIYKADRLKNTPSIKFS